MVSSCPPFVLVFERYDEYSYLTGYRSLTLHSVSYKTLETNVAANFCHNLFRFHCLITREIGLCTVSDFALRKCSPNRGNGRGISHRQPSAAHSFPAPCPSLYPSFLPNFFFLPISFLCVMRLFRIGDCLFSLVSPLFSHLLVRTAVLPPSDRRLGAEGDEALAARHAENNPRRAPFFGGTAVNSVPMEGSGGAPRTARGLMLIRRRRR